MTDAGLSAGTVVVKYGGNAMIDESLKRSFAEDIVFMRRVGLWPVVVHGGGPQISAMLAKFGIADEFKGGLRVTTPEAMDVVRMVLTGQVQREIVALINEHGRFAVGMSGEDAHLFTASRRAATVQGELVDLGQVGEINSVDPSFVRTVVNDGLIPVVSSIARGERGQVFNVNADTAAAALAVALDADKLVVLTDVAGLFGDWPNANTLLEQVTAAKLRELLPTLDNGMAPKMEACLHAVSGGVGSVHLLDGRLEHSLMRGVFNGRGVGTQVLQ